MVSVMLLVQKSLANTQSSMTGLHGEVELYETTGKGIKWLDERAYMFISMRSAQRTLACEQACAEKLGSKEHYLHQHLHQSNSVYISTFKATVNT